MNFLEDILSRLSKTPERPVLREIREGRLAAVTCAELLDSIRAARAFLRLSGVKRGDRCALLGHNSVRWVAVDLAIMAEGAIVVPLYARQAPRELVGMMRDCGPKLLCCSDAALGANIKQEWPEAPPICVLEEVSAFRGSRSDVAILPEALPDNHPVTIVYTSGTSGEPKGVILNVSNINHMLSCTGARLDLLVGQQVEAERIFHYLPFCFAGSWILLLSCLSRHSILALCSDLTKLVDELKLASPQYLLNVPALLERIRSGVEEQLKRRGGFAAALFKKACAAFNRRQEGGSALMDSLWLALADRLIFSAVRKKLGSCLKALICGSAALAKETQMFFMMLGIPVLQVYGLTETTAICTMDHPERITPGYVGPAIPGIEMKLGENSEILVRGPNIFCGYWNRPQETANSFIDSWFRTGDQGEVDSSGNWRIIGRVKNLIVLSSGHNVAPEPIEEALLAAIPGAKQVVLAGHGRSFLAAIVTGEVLPEQVKAALESLNQQLPHYKRVRDFVIQVEPFSIENGLLTANGKLKRDAIASRLHEAIETLYNRSAKFA